MAERARREPGAVQQELEDLRQRIHQMDRQITAKYGKRPSDIPDMEGIVTPQEAQYLFHGEGPTSVEELTSLLRMLEPVDTPAEAAQELASTLQRLPNDLSALSTGDNLALGRLQVLAGDIDRMGGDFKSVLKDALQRYGERFGDPNDAADMVERALNQLRDLHEAGFQFQQQPEMKRLMDRVSEQPPEPGHVAAPPAGEEALAPKPESQRATEEKVTIDEAAAMVEDPNRKIPPEQRKARLAAEEQAKEAAIAAACVTSLGAL